MRQAKKHCTDAETAWIHYQYSTICHTLRGRTCSTHDGGIEPQPLWAVQGFKISPSYAEYFDSIVRRKHDLNALYDVKAVDCNGRQHDGTRLLNELA